MTPAEVPNELFTTARAAFVAAYERDDMTVTALADLRAAIAAVLPVYEKQIREQVAQELLAVDGFEWALAGQDAGWDAAKIARGEK